MTGLVHTVRQTANEIAHMRMAIIAATLMAVLLTIPGQTLEIYRAYSQTLPSWKDSGNYEEATLRLVLPLSLVGLITVSLVIWLTGRRAAAKVDIQAAAATVSAEASNRSGEKRALVLLWLPRLLAVVPLIAAAIGVLLARFDWATGDPVSVKEDVWQAFLRQWRRIKPNDESRAADLAKTAMERLQHFDAYLVNFSWALVLSAAILFLFIVAIDRPALARRLARPRAWPRHLASVSVITLLVASTVAFTSAPVHLPQAMGPIAIMSLFVAMLLLLAFQLQIVYEYTRVPVLTVLVVAALVFSLLDWNDNHPIRNVDEASAERRTAEARDAASAFGRWLDTRRDISEGTAYPVFIVAAQGGGIYAAKHAASFLAEIQDDCPAFGHHLFAISGVSGGSVGAAVFAGLTMDYAKKSSVTDAERFSCLAIPDGQSRRPNFNYSVTNIFMRDLWSPLAAGMLFPDFLQRFIPWPIPEWDRAVWLDQALEAAYDSGVQAQEGGLLASGEKSLRPLSGPFLATWQPETHTHTPALLFNTTEVSTGKRLVIAPFRITGSGLDVLPVWDENGKPAPYAPVLSSAAGLSARFPWISPAAYYHRDVPLKSGELERKKFRIVDGGYFENSGVATALDLVREVNEANKRLGKKLEINLIVFTSSGFEPPAAKGLGELLDPVRAMLSTREARAGITIAEAKNAFRQLSSDGAAFSGKVITLELKGRGYPLPLGWRLSPVTRHQISYQNGDAKECNNTIEAIEGDLRSDVKLEASCAKKFIYDRLRKRS